MSKNLSIEQCDIADVDRYLVLKEYRHRDDDDVSGYSKTKGVSWKLPLASVIKSQEQLFQV